MVRDTRKDFFISYTGADRAWAEWVAWQLEQARFTTIIQAWDFRPGSNFVQAMDSSTKRAKRTIAILSPDYFISGFSASEWQAAFRLDPIGEQLLLLPVRVRQCDVEGLLGSIVYIDLVGYNEQEASERLLAGVRNKRAKPIIAPAFPDGSHIHQKRPEFPGAFPSVQVDWNARLPHAKDVRPESLKLGDIAAAKFPYVVRPIQDPYNEALQALYEASTEAKHSKNGILVLGESNAGKTRLSFEVMKKALPTWPVLRWRPDYLMKNAPPIEFLKGKNLVIFIDDLQDYMPSLLSTRDLEGRNIAIDPRTTIVRSLLETMYQAAQRVVVVATCRNEDRLRAQSLLDWLFIRLKHIVIPDFSEDPKNPEATLIITDFQKQGAIHIEEWDGTLGSLVLGLSTKNSQYLMLPTYPSRILQAMKLLTLAGTQIHTERRLRTLCVHVFGDTDFLGNERKWQESVNQLTSAQFVKEELEEGTREMALVIRKDAYFEKVVTDYPQPHRPYQIERDFAKLREAFVELKDRQALLKLGFEQMFTLKKPEEALLSFDCAIALDPNNASSWNAKGFVYGTIGGLVQPQAGLAAFEHAISLNPDESTSWFGKGQVLEELMRLEEALAAFDRALALKPNNIDAWFHRGSTLQRLECYEEALAAFDQVLALDPNDAEAWDCKGRILYALEYYVDALAAFDLSLTLDMKNASAWDFKGITYRELERYEEALGAFDHSLTLDPTTTGVWYNKGTTLATLDRDDEALAAFESTLALNPNDVNAWAFKGTTLIRLNRLEDALTAFDRALALDEDNTAAWYHKGIALGGLKQPAEALVALEHVLSLDPNNINAWAFKARMLGILERTEETLTAFDRTLSLDPDNAENWLFKGILLGALGQAEEALAAVDHSLALDPTSDIWYHKGRILGVLGRTEEALAAVDHSLALDPNNIDAYVLKGLSNLNQKRPEEALAALDRALLLDPNNTDALYYKNIMLGNLRLEKKHRRKAK